MSSNSSLFLLWILQLGLGLPGRAQSGGRVEIVDLTGRFLAFYDSATARHADPDQRWQLWRRLYNFAAVPPTPFGDSLARHLLDSAWTKYRAALPTIERGPAGLGISPDSGLERVLGLLKCGDSVKLRVTVFVGGFEGNAFAFGVTNDRSNIAIPVEAGNPADRKSTRLNSRHMSISYAVFCFKKKNGRNNHTPHYTKTFYQSTGNLIHRPQSVLRQRYGLT